MRESVGGVGKAVLLEVKGEVIEVDAVTSEEHFGGVGDADDIDLKAALGEEGGLLDPDLVDEATADGADTGDEEVEDIVAGEEEGVVDGVEGFAEELELDDEGDVGFGGALCASDDGDAGASECAEELAGDAGSAFHVLTDDGDGGEVGFDGGVVDLTACTFVGELVVEDVDGEVCIGITDGEGGVVFGGGLRDHEDGDAVIGEGFEDAVVDADDTDHAEALDGDEAGVVNGGDAFDDGFVVGGGIGGGGKVRDEGAFGVGVEGIEDADGDVLLVDGVDGGWIEDFGTEVTELHGFGEGELVDEVGGVDDFGVGGHEAIDVGPYFEGVGVKSSGEDGGGVIGATASEVGDLVIGIGGDEAGDDGDGGKGGEGLLDEGVGRGEVDDVPVEVRDGFDELAGVEELGVGDGGGEDGGGETFTVGEDGVVGFG